MYQYNYDSHDLISSIAKTAAGQAIDTLYPEAGLVYHVAATSTSKNPIDFALGVLGIIGSSSKILNQSRQNV